jgi:hypothetical protein
VAASPNICCAVRCRIGIVSVANGKRHQPTDKMARIADSQRQGYELVDRIQHLEPSFDGGDDFLRAFGPPEWLRVAVVFGEEAIDRRLQFDDGSERGALEASLGQGGEAPSPIRGSRRQAATFESVQPMSLSRVQSVPCRSMTFGAALMAIQATKPSSWLYGASLRCSHGRRSSGNICRVGANRSAWSIEPMCI